jgi:hypothetical protein
MDLDKQSYIATIADLTTPLTTQEWNDPHQLFGPTLTAMNKDALRWLDNEWKAPNGNTTPIERAIVVLTQDLIVLLGHAHNNGLTHDNLNALRTLAENAVAQSIIEDTSHREHFSIADSEPQG